MARWSFAAGLNRTLSGPIYVQLARIITEDIRRGRLAPGVRLPGSRRLARQLEIHRNTVLSAYDELVAGGWVQTKPKKGTFISESLPMVETTQARLETCGSWPHSQQPAYAIPSYPVARRPELMPRGILHLSSGAPDVRLLTVEPLARAYRRVLKLGSGRRLLGYCEPEGYCGLREAVASMLASTRDIAATAANILITRGSQMAFSLLARALVRPGEHIAVESLGYRPAWLAFQQAGAVLHPVGVDQEGLIVDELAQLAEIHPIRALYLTPHHQYPTTVSLAAPRRLHLLKLAAAKQFAVIEDDYDHEFHFDNHPPMPLASLDRSGCVIYVGTFSKVLAPGLRLGYIAAPKALIECLASCRSFLDMYGDHVLEAAVAQLMEEGELQRHIAKARHTYTDSRDSLAAELAARLKGALSFERPTGGMAIWASVSESVNAEQWAQRCLKKGVFVYTGRRYTFSGEPSPQFRLTFGYLNRDELKEAVCRMSLAL
jgi:GntR family transcriptional regulator / MocR family aminotransferase